MNGCIDSFTGNYDFLSNYYPCTVKYCGIFYGSAEAAYQAQKCLKEADRIRFTDLGPDMAKKRGRMVEIRPDWETVKVPVMHGIVRDKFERHPELEERLLATGDAILIEGNDWGDMFWGVDSLTREGQNQLGIILMQVRMELKYENY